MFFRLENNQIVEGPLKSLPKLWADSGGTQRPLRELWSKGHMADVLALGWIEGIEGTISIDPDTQKEGDYEFSVSGGDVLMTRPPVPLNAQELAVRAKDVERQAKLDGVLIDGAVCSATREDMTGLAAVEPWVRAGNNVNFEFSNGTKYLLTAGNVDAFRATWVPFRASFF